MRDGVYALCEWRDTTARQQNEGRLGVYLQTVAVLGLQHSSILLTNRRCGSSLRSYILQAPNMCCQELRCGNSHSSGLTIQPRLSASCATGAPLKRPWRTCQCCRLPWWGHSAASIHVNIITARHLASRCQVPSIRPRPNQWEPLHVPIADRAVRVPAELQGVRGGGSGPQQVA